MTIRALPLLLAVQLASVAALAGGSALSADRILIEKRAHRLSLLYQGHLVKTYKVALGKNAVGPKQRQGDQRTPEGLYKIDSKNSSSSFHRALHISYPDERDRKKAAAMGVEPGGEIMIHGLKNGLGWLGPLHRLLDWTQGCIAVTDAEIEEIWGAVPVGTEVEIRP